MFNNTELKYYIEFIDENTHNVNVTHSYYYKHYIFIKFTCKDEKGCFVFKNNKYIAYKIENIKNYLILEKRIDKIKRLKECIRMNN